MSKNQNWEPEPEPELSCSEIAPTHFDRSRAVQNSGVFFYKPKCTNLAPVWLRSG